MTVLINKMPALAESAVKFGLHVEAHTDGVLVIKDDEGRQLRGIRSIKVTAGRDEVTEITLVVLARIDSSEVKP